MKRILNLYLIVKKYLVIEIVFSERSINLALKFYHGRLFLTHKHNLNNITEVTE
jgi:hypothetical protein